MILGISALHHDSAVCLTKGSDILFASGEERFSRAKNDSRMPHKAIRHILDNFGQPEDIIFYDKLNFRKRNEIKRELKLRYGFSNVQFCEHHRSHAYSAIFTSPWDSRESCAVLVVDTVGGKKATSLGYWNGNHLEWIRSFYYPNSLGLFYSAITRLIGFDSNVDESKTMSAAAFGNPKWKDYMNNYLLEADRSSYYCLHNFERGLGFGTLDFDIAASAQKVLEEILINLCNWLHKETGTTKLAYAGGVALNCVANTKILQQTPFESVWAHPAAGDAGGAMGAAYYAWSYKPKLLKGPPPKWKNAYLGYDAGDVLDPIEVADKIIRGNIVPVLRGKAEWGPRALGNRSFLALPSKINSIRLHDIKGRTKDRWRPWAPICLKSVASNYFDVIQPSYEMMFVSYSKTNKWFPYPDKTARLQVVDEDNNPWLTEVLKRTTENGHPILINTSLNVRGKPIVNTQEDYEKEIKDVFKSITD